MSISKNIILDLIPLYIAGEVSDETKQVVEEYLKTDPEVDKLVKESQAGLPAEIDIPLKKEEKLEALIKIKQLQLIKTVVFSLIISGLFLAVLLAILMFMR